MPALFFAAVATAGSVIAVAGLVTIALGLRRMASARASMGWPSVKGTVLDARIDTEAPDPAAEDDEPRQATTFKPVIEYRFVVNGVTYEGARLAPDELDSGDRSVASDIVRAFPTGSPVDVFYDPTNPERAVLRPGISGASMIFPSVGVGLVVLGLSMVGIAWKVSRHLSSS